MINSAKMAFAVVLLSLSFSAQSQCTGTVSIQNDSDDAWTVDYYGSSITVLSGTSMTLGFTNASPNLERRIELVSTIASEYFSSTPCEYTFVGNSDVWDVPCTAGTSVVYYDAIMSGNGCLNQGRIIME